MKKMIVGIVFLYSTTNAVMVIGHRGASGYAPENTLSSFARAIKCKVDMVEFDVWKCASGELVVFHDAKVNRVTDGRGSIESKALPELKQLTVLGCEKIPTLTEVFDFVDRRVKVYVELKGANIAQDVLQLIEHYVQHKQWQYDDFLVASFDHVQLQTIKAANRLISIAALVCGIPINFGSCGTDILCHNIYAELLKKYSATFMSFTSFLSPLFAALYGWAFFQETITWHFYLSIIIVLIGLYVFYQDELKSKSNYEEKQVEI